MSKQRPADNIRLGTIEAAIWRNETERGVRYNVSVSRSYKDGDTWKTTESFGRDDLLLVMKVLDRAHSRIYELQAADRE